MSAAPPFELHLQAIESEHGERRSLYSYVLNPNSGVAPHLCGALRTTGCPSRAAAEAFVRQRIAELVGSPTATAPPDDCTPLLEDPERLRSFAEERGWLFFGGLLPEAEVLQVRHDLLAVIERHGGLEEGSDPDAGITRAGVVFEGSNPTDAYRRYTNELLAVHSFNALAHHPRLLDVMERLVGTPLLVHPRHICHALFPGADVFKAPPHQDFRAVRGTPATWTAWMPYGELDAALGGVSLAEGSHTRGLLPTAEGMLWVEPNADERWLWGPMAAGDVLMFHSHTVHQGHENSSGNRLRLAGSYRYQRASDPVDAGALLPQHHYGTWDDLYTDWPEDDPLKFYWQSLELNVQPAYHGPKGGQNQ